VPQNYAVAADLYLSAAAQGNAFAQSRLGLSYDKGHGVPQSLILSYKWLDLAAASGVQPRARLLSEAARCGGFENVVGSDR